MNTPDIEDAREQNRPTDQLIAASTPAWKVVVVDEGDMFALDLIPVHAWWYTAKFEAMIPLGLRDVPFSYVALGPVIDELSIEAVDEVAGAAWLAALDYDLFDPEALADAEGLYTTEGSLSEHSRRLLGLEPSPIRGLDHGDASASMHCLAHAGPRVAR